MKDERDADIRALFEHMKDGPLVDTRAHFGHLKDATGVTPGRIGHLRMQQV